MGIENIEKYNPDAEKEKIPKITQEEWHKYGDVDGRSPEGVEEITNFAKEKNIELNNGIVEINVDGKILKLSTDVEEFFTQEY
ncbi:MAG: hypothetical protein V1732_03675 [Patescibacteria group bacterium]